MPATQATTFLTYATSGPAAGTPQVANGVTTSAGAAQANAIPALNSQGKLDSTLFPAGLGADSLSLPFTEAVSAGALVNVFNSSGTSSARNADASAANGAKPATGFVLAAVASGANGTVYFSGLDNVLTGATVGPAYLGTAGAVTSTPPGTSGYLSQMVGDNVSSTALHFSRSPGIIV